jgi:hypothetical protein
VLAAANSKLASLIILNSISIKEGSCCILRRVAALRDTLSEGASEQERRNVILIRDHLAFACKSQRMPRVSCNFVTVECCFSFCDKNEFHQNCVSLAANELNYILSSNFSFSCSRKCN